MTPQIDVSLRDKLLGLAAFRLAIAAVLLVAMHSGASSFGPTAQISLSLAIVGLFSTALLHALAIWLGIVRRSLAYTQVLLDIAALTVVVWFTGAASSPFAFLFCLVVIEAAGTLSARDTLIAAGVACVALVCASALPAPEHEPFARIAAHLIAQIAAVIGVATLCATLVSETMRARLRLESTQGQLQGLSDLHERVLLGLQSGIVSVDQNGIIGFINPAGRRILSLADDALLIGKPLESVVEELQGSDFGERAEISVRKPSGEVVTLGLGVVPLYGGSGAMVGRTFIFRDLTAIREEEALHRRNAELASLGRLAANIAHEIRNPLGSLTGSIELIQQTTPLDRDQSALLDIVLREMTRLDGLVREFLDYARPQTADRVTSDLGLIAEETVRIFRLDPLLGPRTLTCETETTLTEVDPGQIRQVLLNLLRNAAAATQPHGHLAVRAWVSPEEALLSVSDDGPGLSEEVARSIFEPFSAPRQGVGGLGLAIVSQLVQQNGGSVSVSRDKGRTRFLMRWPRV